MITQNNKPSEQPRAEWTPFFVAIITQFIAATAIAFWMISSRAESMAQNLSFEHCRNVSGGDIEYLMNVCAHNTMGLYMSDPHYLARFLVIIVVVSGFLALWLSRWGRSRFNRVMWFSGLVAAILLFSYGRQMLIPAIGLLIGHSIGHAYSGFKLKSNTSTVHKR